MSNNLLEEVFVDSLQDLSVFSGVRVTRSLFLCVCFVDRCLSFCAFFTIVLSVLRYTVSDCPLLPLQTRYYIMSIS